MKIWWLYARPVYVGHLVKTIILPVATTRNFKGLPAYLPLGRHKCKADALSVAHQQNIIYFDYDAGVYRFTPDGIKKFI